MIQPIDNNKPTYNAVKINITKPEVNKGIGVTNVNDDNGIYNAVDINIDNPSVNTPVQQIYDYPQAESVVTYDMANIAPVKLPQGFQVAYQTTNVILPQVENEFELSALKTYEQNENRNEEDESVEYINEYESTAIPAETKDAEYETITVSDTDETDTAEMPAVPEANYTTTEAEKENIISGLQYNNDNQNKTTENQEVENKDINFKATQEIKRPEIIPGTEIKPEVDVTLVLSNLNNSDFDVQAQQMEEIARISLDNSENAVPYIVREIFASLIETTQKDTSTLEAPTEEQINARKKIIANILSLENENAQQGQTTLPFQLSNKEIELANELSPMEQAERNKEYALYTMAILAKIYADEVEKQTGNIVPMTDLPGMSAMVDSLRYNPNAGVKIAAIDSLKHIARPEYKDELNTIFSLAQADTNPQVVLTAESALQKINNMQN